MATQRKHRRGTTAELNAFTPAQAEIVVDTTLNQLRVGDGSTLGGHKVPTSASPTFTGDVTADSIKTSGSSGVVVKNSGGTTVATIGASNTTATSLAGTLTVGGLITATAGQIAFPATQNPSANANTLDDYEEGTWTPAIAFGGGATGITYTSQSGKYTKIGDTVYIRCAITLSNKGSSVGAATVTGLPFATSGNAVGFLVINSNGSSWPNNSYAITSSSSLLLRANSSTGITELVDTNFTNTTNIITSLIYNV